MYACKKSKALRSKNLSVKYSLNLKDFDERQWEFLEAAVLLCDRNLTASCSFRFAMFS